MSARVALWCIAGALGLPILVSAWLLYAIWWEAFKARHPHGAGALVLLALASIGAGIAYLVATTNSGAAR